MDVITPMDMKNIGAMFRKIIVVRKKVPKDSGILAHKKQFK